MKSEKIYLAPDSEGTPTGRDLKEFKSGKKMSDDSSQD